MIFTAHTCLIDILVCPSAMSDVFLFCLICYPYSRHTPDISFSLLLSAAAQSPSFIDEYFQVVAFVAEPRFLLCPRFAFSIPCHSADHATPEPRFCAFDRYALPFSPRFSIARLFAAFSQSAEAPVFRSVFSRLSDDIVRRCQLRRPDTSPLPPSAPMSPTFEDSFH